MDKGLRNCRNCLACYEKPTDYWCEIPLTKDDKIVEPIGYCEFCDRNSRYFIDKPKRYMENEEINDVVGLNADPVIEDKPKRKEPNVCLSCEG